jgi:hypothetical protein
MIIFDRNLINQLIVSLKNKIMEENKEDAVSKITANKTAVAATPKPRKPRVSKSTKEVGTTAEIHVAEENQLEPFLEEAGSLIELEPKKDKKKKKNKKKEKEKKKAKKAKEKAKEKAKAKAKKAKKAKKEKAKKAKVKAKAKEKKAKAKAKKAKKNKKNKSKKK